jgi:hypothetical protein
MEEEQPFIGDGRVEFDSGHKEHLPQKPASSSVNAQNLCWALVLFSVLSNALWFHAVVLNPSTDCIRPKLIYCTSFAWMLQDT